MTPEQALRDEWGRLLALLVAQFRRLDLAEDGLAEAFEQAVRHWPVQGPPVNPAAWLLTTPRNRITDKLRSEAVLARRMVLLAVDARLTEQAATDEVIDERLRLVLLCAHPRLSREAAAALTLRLVLPDATPASRAVVSCCWPIRTAPSGTGPRSVRPSRSCSRSSMPRPRRTWCRR